MATLFELLNQLVEEQMFRDWYSAHAQRLGLNPDPYHPQHFYDFRSAWKAGAQPNEIGHWPSQFKLEGHPNLYINGIDTRTGKEKTK